jgi:hypothetical protein
VCLLAAVLLPLTSAAPFPPLAHLHAAGQGRIEATPEPPFDDRADRILDGLAGWREAPDYVALFAPAAHASQYRAFTSPDPLETILRRIAATTRDIPSGAWAVESLGPRDAFGPDGRHRPYSLARLYTAGPAQVARGPRASANGFDAWTLISPYPDAGLTRLSRGTLLLVLRVPPL